ncbi:MAG: hypothetical protein J5758_05540, partial [Abditibacteriota bacterium]|nr:hypothetical protein [Abditibacteriota bacterium]
DLQPWTGCTVCRDGRYYLFYTMRSSADGGTRQKIGLAISRDGQHFEKYGPVIEPGEPWYITDYSDCGSLDCRDLTVTEYEGGYIGYFVARRKGRGAIATNCIGCARSDDLLHWQLLPPVFTSDKYSCTECPDVFCVDGKWYLTMSTANEYGSIVRLADKHVSKANIYAVADSPFGPFREPPANVLLAAGGCFRTLMFRGERYGIFCAASASRPYLVRAKGGRLWLEEPAGLLKTGRSRPSESESPRELLPHPAWRFTPGKWEYRDGVYRGSSPSGYQAAHIFNVPSEAYCVECLLDVRGRGGGIVIRPHPGSDTSHGDTCIYYDKKERTLQISTMADMSHNIWNTRSIPGGKLLLKIIGYEDRIDVYLDGALLLHAAWGRMPEPETGIGLMTDGGETFCEFR